MSREDWEIFDEIKRERKQRRAERRAAFSGGPGWTQHHETHWSYQLLGEQLDYWPGPMRWRWRKKNSTGDVMAFIRKKEKQLEPRKDQ